MKARPKQRLGGADVPDCSIHVSVELPEASGRRVGQSPFGLGPNEFVGIEFRSVCRESVDAEPGMPPDKNPDTAVSVDGAAVPEQDHRSPQVLQEMAQETDHFQSGDVGTMEPRIEPHSSADGRDRKGGDGRQTQPFVQVPQLWRPATRRPGVAEVRNEQEPTFVEKSQMGSLLKGVFLYAATGNASNGRWRPRRVRAPVAGASGTSSPAAPSVARRAPGGSEPGTVGRSGVRSEGVSTHPWNNRQREDRRPGARPAASSGAVSAGEAVLAWVWNAKRLGLPSDGTEPSGQLS
jgi:hypothetical protein